MENVSTEGINMILFVILLATGFLLSIVSFIFRARTGGKYEIRPVDLILVMVPVFLWLFSTGKISKFNVAGLGFETTAETFVRATEQSIEFTEMQTPETLIEDIMNNVEMARKAGVDEIPKLIKKKTEALEFQLGYGRYWGPAIEKYFEIINAAGFLKYILIYDSRRRLFGIYDSQPLLVHLQNRGREEYNLFEKYLNLADQPSMKALQRLPGFVSVSDAVTPESSKRIALETMERLKSDILPVIDEKQNRQFIGIVERNKITASLIIDVTKAMEELTTKSDGK